MFFENMKTVRKIVKATLATTPNRIENEIKSWMQLALKKEPVNMSVDILGNAEKDFGYMGNVTFVKTNGGIERNFVVKYSEKDKEYRKNHPVREAFYNETRMYEDILPRFIQFQKENGVADIFDNIPKYYGSVDIENVETILLENMKDSGYDLWPKKKPLTRKHVDLIIENYGKFHATSVAIEKHQPDEFQKWTRNLHDIFGISNQTKIFFDGLIEESYHLFKDDLSDKVLSRWWRLKDQINFVIKDMPKKVQGVKVILHGDCWNNNFMFLHQLNKVPQEVTFLDFQASRHSSPILDLSNFLFSCLSGDDFENLDKILVDYHKFFVNHLRSLGVEGPELVYPFEEFMDDWKSFSRFGVIMTNLLMKTCSTDKDEVVDVDVRKERIRPVIEYAVRHDLI